MMLFSSVDNEKITSFFSDKQLDNPASWQKENLLALLNLALEFPDIKYIYYAASHLVGPIDNDNLALEFFKALETTTNDPDCAALLMPAYASLCFRFKKYDECLRLWSSTAIHFARVRQTYEIKENEKRKTSLNQKIFNDASRQTLTYLAEKVRIIPVALFGTLLGLERSGSILPHDKDIDLGVWEEDAAKVFKALNDCPFLHTDRRQPYDNYAAYLHNEKVTFDVSVLKRCTDTGTVETGFSSAKDPEDWRMITHLPSFATKIQDTQLGNLCIPDNAPEVLSHSYGVNWAIPDPAFVSFVDDPSWQPNRLHNMYVKMKLVQLLNTKPRELILAKLQRMLEYYPSDFTFLETRFLLSGKL